MCIHIKAHSQYSYAHLKGENPSIAYTPTAPQIHPFIGKWLSPMRTAPSPKQCNAKVPYARSSISKPEIWRKREYNVDPGYCSSASFTSKGLRSRFSGRRGRSRIQLPAEGLERVCNRVYTRIGMRVYVSEDFRRGV